MQWFGPIITLLLGGSLLFVAKAAAAKQPEQQAHPTTRQTPVDFLVEGLENVEPAFGSFDGSMYAGLIPSTRLIRDDDVDNDDDETPGGKLMFWLFEPHRPTFNDKLVIWLNGGPGCSSLGGCLFEHCPVTVPPSPAGFFGIDIHDPLKPNPFAWTKASSMLYVEQPHGVGFSTGPSPKDEADVSRYFYYFLQNFYDIFEHMRRRRLYFFGESYAGMYVPSIAHYIHQENKKKKEGQQQHHPPIINLAGIAVGNGWMDARHQGPAVIDYAWWHGMIDSSTRRNLHQEWKNCRDGSKQRTEPFHRFTTPDECGIMEAVLQAAGKGAVDWGSPNAYDVTTWDPYTFLDVGTMEEFYNKPAVQDALNVQPPHAHYWSACIAGAGRRRRRRRLDHHDGKNKLPGELLLAHDAPVSVVPYIADLLDDDDAGIRVLIYNGDRDMTVAAAGSEMLLDGMEWSGAKGWSDPSYFQRGLWLVNNSSPHDHAEVGGYVKTYKKLEFVVVTNSGHLVPFNRPNVAYDLVTRFLGNESYVDKVLTNFHITSTSQKEPEEPEISSRSITKPKQFGVGARLVLVALVGFFLGIFVSRGVPSKRQEYEMVPSHTHDHSI